MKVLQPSWSFYFNLAFAKSRVAHNLMSGWKCFHFFAHCLERDLEDWASISGVLRQVKRDWRQDLKPPINPALFCLLFWVSSSARQSPLSNYLPQGTDTNSRFIVCPHCAGPQWEQQQFWLLRRFCLEPRAKTAKFALLYELPIVDFQVLNFPQPNLSQRWNLSLTFLSLI